VSDAGHFGVESFRSVTCGGTDNLTKTTLQQIEHTNRAQNNTTKKVALVNSTTDTLKKPRLRDRTHRARFSRLLRQPARKRTGSILSTPEPVPRLGHRGELTWSHFRKNRPVKQKLKAPTAAAAVSK